MTWLLVPDGLVAADHLRLMQGIIAVSRVYTGWCNKSKTSSLRQFSERKHLVDMNISACTRHQASNWNSSRAHLVPFMSSKNRNLRLMFEDDHILRSDVNIN